MSIIMDLYLVVPVEDEAMREKGHEEINGRRWRISGPLDTKKPENLQYHCVSYVWGHGTESVGAFFDCKREISDQTRPALIAAIKAAEALHSSHGTKPVVDKFWIDALCIPQIEGLARSRSLASMGFIYSAAKSVIVVLGGPIWEVIAAASAEKAPKVLSYEQMEILELDTWISRVWTYQELVNARESVFAAINPRLESQVIRSERFLHCVGFSLDRWRKNESHTVAEVLERFPHLNVFEDTLADVQMAGYLERSALGVLSNIAYRVVDVHYPQNRLLACLGALAKDVSWGPPSTSGSEIARELMRICETKNDFSFIYTSDPRDEEQGSCWRPNPTDTEETIAKAIHLRPIISWSISGVRFGETQRGHNDLSGFWLDGIIRLQTSVSIGEELTQNIDSWLYGIEDIKRPEALRCGFYRPGEFEGLDMTQVLLMAVQKMGFTGSPQPHICETGIFFSQEKLTGRESVEMFATSSLQWIFGSPGFARWNENGGTKYSAGVFVGFVRADLSESILMI